MSPISSRFVSTSPALLTSNGVPVLRGTSTLGSLRAYTEELSDGAKVCDRFREDGYLLCPGLLDREAVLELRSAYYATTRPSGARAELRTPDVQEVVAHGVAGHPAHSFVRTQKFREFTASPALREIAEVLLGSDSQLLTRQILRDYGPGSHRASRAHTDHVYIDRGTEHVVTAWIPIGDCTIADGALVYLEGSHQLQPQELDPLRAISDRSDPRPLSHDLGWVSQSLGRRWLAADYQAGDVVFHSPHMIHATLDVTGTMSRLSTDIRFIPASEPADERWQEHWSGDDGY